MIRRPDGTDELVASQTRELVREAERLLRDSEGVVHALRVRDGSLQRTPDEIRQSPPGDADHPCRAFHAPQAGSD